MRKELEYKKFIHGNLRHEPELITLGSYDQASSGSNARHGCKEKEQASIKLENRGLDFKLVSKSESKNYESAVKFTYLTEKFSLTPYHIVVLNSSSWLPVAIL